MEQFAGEGKSIEQIRRDEDFNYQTEHMQLNMPPLKEVVCTRCKKVYYHHTPEHKGKCLTCYAEQLINKEI